MGRLECCRICLITDVKMERIEGSLENNIKSVFGHNVLFSSDFPDYACYECGTLIAKFSKFKKKYLTAQSLLFNILQNHGVVTEKEIKALDRKASHLSSNLSISHIDNHINFMEVKIEPDPMEDVPDMIVEEDSGSDDDMPLNTVKSDEYVSEKSKNNRNFLKMRNMSAPEIEFEETSSKTKKLNASDGKKESMLKDFVMTKLTRKLDYSVPESKSINVKKRISYEQRQLMLQYMIAHPNIAIGRPLGPDGYRVRQNLLQELAEILNSTASGCRKTPEKWMKSWQDWRVDVKAKAIAIKLGQNKLGSSQLTPLTPIEEQLTQFIGIEIEGFDAVDVPDPLLYQTEVEDQNPPDQHMGEEVWISAPTQQETSEVPVTIAEPSPGESFSEMSKEQPQKRKRPHIAAFSDDPLLPHMKIQAEAMQQQAEAMQRIAGALESIAMAFNKWSAGTM